MVTIVRNDLTLPEIDEAIANARATLKAHMPADQREACEDYLNELLEQRTSWTNRARYEAKKATRVLEARETR